MTLFNPSLINQITRCRSSFDESDHEQQRRIGIAFTGTQCAPDDSVGSRVDGTHVFECDAIPTVVRHGGFCHPTEELQRDWPGKALALTKLWTAIVATTALTKCFGVHKFLKRHIPLDGPIEGLAQCKVGDVQIASQLVVRELLAIGNGFKAMGGAIFWQQRF